MLLLVREYTGFWGGGGGVGKGGEGVCFVSEHHFRKNIGRTKQNKTLVLTIHLPRKQNSQRK